MNDLSNQTQFNIKDIINVLPHRYPFILIDRIEIIEPGKSLIALKNLTINEPFFQGHFPEKPIMPGVFIVEALAQTASILVMHSLNLTSDNKLVYFMSIEGAKFRKPVFPNCKLNLNVKRKQHRKLVWKFSGEAKVNNFKVANATFSAMIIK